MGITLIHQYLTGKIPLHVSKHKLAHTIVVTGLSFPAFIFHPPLRLPLRSVCAHCAWTHCGLLYRQTPGKLPL